jgi:hypothetical protein
MTDHSIEQLVSRIERLEAEVFRKKQKAPPRTVPNRAALQLDFSINIRAFMKRYATGRSGPKKFVILLAYIVKGDTSKEISLNELKASWNRMSAKNFLGKFNGFYSNEAKTRGWVDSNKHGAYHLSEEWKSVLL